MWLDRVLPSRLPNESIVFYLRPHWIVFARKLVLYLGLFILPIVVIYLLERYRPETWDRIWSGGLFEVLVQLALSLYYLAVW